MAEGTSADNNSWESWFGGWVQAAKEKSSVALEFVKKDLAEFSDTIQKGTEQALEKTSSSLSRENTEQATTKVKAGISSFLGNISKVLVIPPSDDYVPVKVSADGSTLYDRGKARLHAIQLDASTYVDSPHGSQEQFDMWLNSFDMDQHKGEISEILVSKVEVRALYTKLVPNEVSHAEFWQRYFYRVHQLQCDEARKQALMQRADRTQGDSLGWDDDDWSGGEEDDDDGNHSDWEKMPRPQQPRQPIDDTQKAEEICSIPPQSVPSPSLTHKSTNNSTVQDPNISTTDKNNITESDIPNISSRNSDDAATSCDKDSTSCSTKVDSGLETVHNHFSADCIPKAVASQEASERDPHPSNLNVPIDTASASTPEEQVVLQENYKVSEPGSPAEMLPGSSSEGNSSIRNPTLLNQHQSPGATSAAAASGVELCSSSDDRNVVTGDAACGAADVLSSPSPSLSTLPQNDNAPVPDASSASKNALNVPDDNSLLLVAEDQESNSTADVVSVNGEKSEPNEECGSTVSAHQLAEPVTCDVGEAVHIDDPDLAMRVKGDMVVVGETDTPSSDSSEPKGLGDDWEEDFDVELTEEDLKAAEDIAKKLGENLDAEDDDWENWD